MTSPDAVNAWVTWRRIAIRICAAVSLLLLVVSVWKDLYGPVAFFPLVVSSGDIRRLGAIGTLVWLLVLVVAFLVSKDKVDHVSKSVLRFSVLATAGAFVAGGLLSLAGLSEIKREIPELRQVEGTVYRAVSFLNWSGEYQVVRLFACDTTGQFCQERGRLAVAGDGQFQLNNVADGMEITDGSVPILTYRGGIWKCPKGIQWILECSIQ